MNKTECSECGRYGGHQIRIDDSDKTDMYDRVFQRKQVCGECFELIDRSATGDAFLPESERTCTTYDCTESLRPAHYGGNLTVCTECQRYHIPTITSRGRMYAVSVCACCERSLSLEFHHWDYETDEGIHLCEECHAYIHRNVTATEQAKLTPGNESWEIDAVSRLKNRHEERHGDAPDAATFEERYNIPTRFHV